MSNEHVEIRIFEMEMLEMDEVASTRMAPFFVPIRYKIKKRKK